VLGDAELEGLLRRSQEISSHLTSLVRSRGDAEEAVRVAQGRLSMELDREILALRSQWDAAGERGARRALLPRIKALRLERDSLRRATPSLVLPSVPDAPTDDPDELLERADALLDSVDKLRREEKAIALRIEELKGERELERRMNEFLSEESLFDDHDRKLSYSRRGREIVAATTDSASGAPDNRGTPAPPSAGGAPPRAPKENERVRLQPEPPATLGYNENDAASPGGKAVFNTQEAPRASAVPGPKGAASPGQHPGLEELLDDGARAGSLEMPPDRRFDGRPFSEEESLEALEARRGKIRALADQMHRKAEETARRARELK
jgi:hypothetical protein